MGSLPKPLIGLLLGTIAFFALWMVALKPSSSSSSSGGSKGGLGQYQSAINKAHQAVTTSNQANAKVGAPTATTAAPVKTATTAAPAKTATTTTTTAASAGKAKATTASSAAKPRAKSGPVSTAVQVKTVDDAIRNHKVLATLFYNPAAADDQSMVKELSQVRTTGVPLVKVAAPVSQLTQFAAITTKVPVATSPTLVIIDPKGRATTIAGWASLGEISTRIADAASAK